MANKNETPSQTNGITLFIITTIFYFVFKVRSGPSENTYLFIIYIAIILIGETIINAQNSAIICGKSQINNAIWYTILPWVIIFGILTLFLNIFPGWLIPFSNTFGYLVARISDLDTTLTNIIKDPELPEGSVSPKTSEALGKIYMDQSLLINQIPNPSSNLKGFNDFMQLLKNGKLLKKGWEHHIPDLKYYIKLKTAVAECVWYLLAGALTLTTSYNYIIKSSCNVSVKEMEKRHHDYEEEIAKETDDTDDSIPDRVYSSYE